VARHSADAEQADTDEQVTTLVSSGRINTVRQGLPGHLLVQENLLLSMPVMECNEVVPASCAFAAPPASCDSDLPASGLTRGAPSRILQAVVQLLLTFEVSCGCPHA
jgi:hypothetical protein